MTDDGKILVRLWNRPDELHELKTHTDAFQAVIHGTKKAEFRRDDRGFHVGDLLVLREVLDREIVQGYGNYTGEVVIARVTHLLRGPAYGIPEGYVMMSLGKDLFRMRVDPRAVNVFSKEAP